MSATEGREIHYCEGGSVGCCARVVPFEQTAMTESSVTCERCLQLLLARDSAWSIEDFARKVIIEAITESVAKEREACAKLVESLDLGYPDGLPVSAEIARQIRGRT